MRLIKYRDAGMHTYTYFWVGDSNRVISPFFDSDIKATKWYNQQLTELRQNGTTDIRREMACGESTKASQEKSQEAVDGTR
jgi:hypothetical protein